VIHEGNLHHLIADLTIRRGDWDAYLREVEFDAGPAALAYAQRVRALEAGPDYDGVPMLRRLLQRSRGAIVHSHCVETELRQAGFTGPVARVPHGAWIPQADRLGYRWKLGLDEATPLIGIFGFLKPYKRIAESLRAFRRLLRVNPRARMILVGEPHPEFQLTALIDSLGLAPQVRTLGFTPIDDFVGYLAACDIVLNLRYPTVGENSGTLMRALGLGKAVIVSDVGSFREFPDEVCLKVPVDAYEEDHLFEYLNLLVNRTDLRAQLGARARDWVDRECNWPLVAQRYHCFLESVTGLPRSTGPCPVPAAPAAAPPVEVPPEYIQSWSARDATTYVEQHLTRLAKTLAITPPGGPNDRILEMGAYLQITPSLKTQLGYGEVRGCYYGPAGKTNTRTISAPDGEEFTCEIDLFDAEKDPFPYPDESFSTVLCCELIEHLAEDPMQMMSEVNRILKPGGHFVLTTPNLGSVRAISAILQGYHPGFFPAYIRPAAEGEEADARHTREYTPMEIRFLFRDAGLELTLLETGAFRDLPKPEHEWVLELLERYLLPRDLRGDGIYAVGRKIGPVRDRYPTWLYS
jgi:glycosyltransferase involved in cell wall biosynthesis/SAM-dependent methyltransferase